MEQLNLKNEVRYNLEGIPQFVVFNDIIYRVLRIFTGTKQYSLNKLVSETWDIELSNPTNNEKTSVILSITTSPYNLRIIY